MLHYVDITVWHMSWPPYKLLKQIRNSINNPIEVTLNISKRRYLTPKGKCKKKMYMYICPPFTSGGEWCLFYSFLSPIILSFLLNSRN